MDESPLRILIKNRAETNTDAEACPKCATPLNPNAQACAKCGLSHRKMAQYARSTIGPVVDVLTVAWNNAKTEWEIQANHDEVLRLVVANSAWAWAATKYRNEMRRRPGDKIGEEMLARIEKGLIATTLGLKQPREQADEKKPYRAVIFLLVIAIAALIIGLVWMKLRGGADDSPPGDESSTTK